MKLRLVVGMVMMTILSGCNLSLKKSGIEIMSTPSAKVYIGGKEAGMTPYKNNTLSPGEIDIRLVANNQEWAKKIHLENGANTVVNREFTKDSGGGYILYFESTGDVNSAGIMVSSQPDSSTVYLDDEIKGQSPLRIVDVGEGDKKMTISYPGQKSISTFIKLIEGYQLVVEADLPTEEQIATPTPSAAPISSEKKVSQVEIKDTETGWLRVRVSPDGNSGEVAKVKPTEKYVLIEEKTDWYKIDLLSGKSGWISAKYARKL